MTRFQRIWKECCWADTLLMTFSPAPTFMDLRIIRNHHYPYLPLSRVQRMGKMCVRCVLISTQPHQRLGHDAVSCVCHILLPLITYFWVIIGIFLYLRFQSPETLIHICWLFRSTWQWTSWIGKKLFCPGSSVGGIFLFIMRNHDRASSILIEDAAVLC